MRFIPIISLSILILLLTACSADTGSSVNASANQSQDQPHQDIAALPLTDSGLSLLVKDYTYTPKPQADPGVCLKIAFRQLCVPGAALIYNLYVFIISSRKGGSTIESDSISRKK